MFNVLNKEVVGIQPLPSLQFHNNLHTYSEFPSYGLGVILTKLRENGLQTGALIHATSAKQIVEGISGAEAIILGDFRPYAYFCNPAPLVLETLQVLADAGYEGQVLVGGRHIEFYGEQTKHNQRFESLDIIVCYKASDIGLALGMSVQNSSYLGDQALPDPGLVDSEYVIDKSLLGSIREGTSLSVGQIMTYSGCRYNCAFCEKAQTPVVPFPKVSVARQLEIFAKNHINYIIVWDEVFGQKGTELEGFLREVKARGMRFGCNTRLDIVSEQFVEKVSLHGCQSILFGVEVSSQEKSGRALLRLDKGKAPEEERYNSVTQLLKRHGIKPVASMIIGLPEDTEITVKQRIAKVKAYGFEHVYVRPLVPFPESQFYKRMEHTREVMSFEKWNYVEFDTYPLGYPTLSKIDRVRLHELTESHL